MSGKCSKCCGEITACDVSAVCAECKSSFHPSCTRFGSAQNVTKSKLKSWRCDPCRGETGSTASMRSTEEGEDKRSILEALSAMKSELSLQISGVQGSIATLSEELRELSTKVQDVQKEQSALNRRCDNLEQSSSKTTELVRELQARLLDVEQHSRSANVEIQGLPCTTGEDVYYALSCVAKAIGVPYNRGDISIAHRLKRYSTRHAHPPVIVQFVSRSVKEMWTKAARNVRGINSSLIDPNLQPSTVYINDHLTRDNKALLGRARRLFRERKVCYASYTNGKVLVKKQEKDDITRVTAMDQLDVFDK